jgi:Acyl-CoA reductase (LuxC)
MNLPNYFLADLPPEATLTAAMIGEACQTLKRNREQYLAARSTQSLVKVLTEIGASWLEPNYPFRQMALQQGPDATGFSRPTLSNGLDRFFSQLTRENLHSLLLQDLGHAQRLDQMVATSAEQKLQSAAMGIGPELLVHVAAGNVPNPTWMSIVLGLLVRSAQFVKCASGTSLLPRLFAHSLYDAEPKLASCLEIAEWPGGRTDLEIDLFKEADCVTATGSDETLTEIRYHLPLRVRFLGYGHRVSFGYITNEVLSEFGAKKIVARAVTDMVAWNQLGCLSPHVLYVEHGGSVSAEQFGEMLAEELSKREETEPRGELPVEIAATIASKRGFYQIRAGHSPDTRLWASKDSTAWTVVYEADARFQFSCLHRFIYVKGVTDLTEALQNADTVRGKVSTVGLAAAEDKAQELATQLGRWGVTRICPLGKMQSPPLTWRHDGQPALGDLVTWSDWEQ